MSVAFCPADPFCLSTSCRHAKLPSSMPRYVKSASFLRFHVVQACFWTIGPIRTICGICGILQAFVAKSPKDPTSIELFKLWKVQDHSFFVRPTRVVSARPVGAYVNGRIEAVANIHEDIGSSESHHDSRDLPVPGFFHTWELGPSPIYGGLLLGKSTRNGGVPKCYHSSAVSQVANDSSKCQMAQKIPGNQTWQEFPLVDDVSHSSTIYGGFTDPATHRLNGTPHVKSSCHPWAPGQIIGRSCCPCWVGSRRFSGRPNINLHFRRSCTVGEVVEGFTWRSSSWNNVFEGNQDLVVKPPDPIYVYIFLVKELKITQNIPDFPWFSQIISNSYDG